MYRIEVKRHFSAAHQLRGYQGKCENLHGHNWVVALTLQAEKTDDSGLAFDFGQAKKILKSLLVELDHAFLNEHPAFQKRNPTSENIACYLAEKAAAVLAQETGRRVQVFSVAVWESAGSKATYYPR